ncbi:MAG: AraC family transcriptional regulator [Pseudomonadales bacterium]
MYFRCARMAADTSYPQHAHPWGEFVYSYSGVMEVKLAHTHYLAPPQYGLWLPPNVEHRGLNRYEAEHCSIYVDTALCGQMPQHSCALTISPLIRALLEHLGQRCGSDSALPDTLEYRRQLQVLFDLLAQASCAGSYLPTSDDPVLCKVLSTLRANPSDSRSAAQWAQFANTTERTLLRRCQRELGMSFNHWRQRCKVVAALALLETVQSVESIALDLGYSSSSAFIAMFKRLMHCTPEEFRRSAGN